MIEKKLVDFGIKRLEVSFVGIYEYVVKIILYINVFIFKFFLLLGD